MLSNEKYLLVFIALILFIAKYTIGLSILFMQCLLLIVSLITISLFIYTFFIDIPKDNDFRKISIKTGLNEKIYTARDFHNLDENKMFIIFSQPDLIISKDDKKLEMVDGLEVKKFILDNLNKNDMTTFIISEKV